MNIRHLLQALRRHTVGRGSDIYGAIADISTPNASFYVMTALSTTIACYGLIANSTAVVIGAMLVAPLMGPIFGIALGLIMGDRRLLLAALRSEILGVLLALALAALFGMLPLRLPYGSEILGRTHPTLYDIIIALASGLAGAYAQINKRISVALPGVAIATAIVPPLATCGLCLAAAQWRAAGGAFLLFFANFLAIEIAAALVFLLFGLGHMRHQQTLTAAGFLQRFGVSLGLLAVVSVFMTGTLVHLIQDQQMRQQAQQALEAALSKTVGAQLTDMQVRRQPDSTDVSAVVLSPQEIGPEQVARLEEELRRQCGKKIRLVVRSLLSRDADRNGTVYLTDAEREQSASAASRAAVLNTASDVLRERLRDFPGARLADIRREEIASAAAAPLQQPGTETSANPETDDPGPIALTAVIQTPAAIDPTQVADLQARLQTALRQTVYLTVRSVLIRDADASRYLYQPEKRSAPLSLAQQRFRERLERALRRELAGAVPGAVLNEMRYGRIADGAGATGDSGGSSGGKPERLRILASARAPRVVSPAAVAQIQATLRRYVDPTADLVIRTEVGADAAPAGYLNQLDEMHFLGE